jgi:hypothetical protein
MIDCSICKNEIHDVSEIVSCHCGSKYHKIHLAAWIATHTFCPICRSEFEDTFVFKILQDVNPQNYDEELLESFKIDQEIAEQKRAEFEIIERKRKTQKLVNPEGGTSRLFSSTQLSKKNLKKTKNLKLELILSFLFIGLPIIVFAYLTNSGENP